MIGNIHRKLGLACDDVIDLKRQQLLVLGRGDTAVDCTCIANAREVELEFLFNASPVSETEAQPRSFVPFGCFRGTGQGRVIHIVADADKAAGLRLLATRLAESDEREHRRPQAIKVGDQVL